MSQQDGPALLEDALARVEAAAESAERAGAAALREIKRARAAAKTGVLRDLDRALGLAEGLSDALADAARTLRRSWSFDDRSYLESGGFAREVTAAAAAEGIPLVERDGTMLTFPSVIRPLPADAAIEIDNKREKRIRPSVVVARMRALRERPPRFRPQPFLEALYSGYRLLLRHRNQSEGASVQLVRLYELMTLLPGRARDYSEPEFVRDIYLLESSGVTQTKDGRNVTFPAATGTKTKSKLVTVTREGDQRIYYAIAFRP